MNGSKKIQTGISESERVFEIPTKFKKKNQFGKNDNFTKWTNSMISSTPEQFPRGIDVTYLPKSRVCILIDLFYRRIFENVQMSVICSIYKKKSK